MYMDGKWYTEPEVVAYVKSLKEKIKELETALEEVQSDSEYLDLDWDI